MINTYWKKDIIKFLSAQTISLFGSSLVQFAIIWYITLNTQSGVMMSIATICGFVPQLLISLFAGVWVDRYSRKVMCMLPDGIIAIATLLIMISFLMGYTSVYLLFFVLCIRSAMTGIQTPAVNSIIPEIVPQDHLMRVNGIHSTIQSLMMFLAPALSGVILTFLRFEYTFMIDVITAIIGIGIMFTIKIKHEKQIHETVSMKQDMKTTFLYLKEHVMIKYHLIYLFIVCFFISPAAFLTPLMITRTFGAELWRLSASEMIFSLGAVAGGILISSWGGFKSHRFTVIVATAFYGSMMVGLGVSSYFIGYMVCNCLIGISMPCFNAPSQVVLQEEVEPSMHGRIFSLVQIANACALPLGTALFGPLADFVDVHYIFIFTGIIVVMSACIAYAYLKKSKTI